MDKSEFQKYLASKQKLTKEFKNIDELEEKYNKVMKTKQKLNEYQKQYHNDMMANDPEYVEKRKVLNRKSYERYKEKHPYVPKKQNLIKQDKQDNNPVEKQDIENPAHKQDLENPIRKQQITLDTYFGSSMLGI
jgi:alpha-L-fucosidase